MIPESYFDVMIPDLEEEYLQEGRVAMVAIQCCTDGDERGREVVEVVKCSIMTNNKKVIKF